MKFNKSYNIHIIWVLEGAETQDWDKNNIHRNTAENFSLTKNISAHGIRTLVNLKQNKIEILHQKTHHSQTSELLRLRKISSKPKKRNDNFPMGKNKS